MTPLHLTVLGLALAGLTAASQAASVTVEFDNPIFSGVPAPSYDSVSITYPKQSGTGSQSAGVAAGRFQGRVLAYDGVDASIFVDGLDDLYMYCYDVYEHIGGAWVVDYTINLSGENVRTLDFLGAVNGVLNQGSPAVDPYAWLRPGSGFAAAAIQLGIWESKYDTGPWDIGNGSFKATNLDAGTRSALDTFFAAIDGAAALDGQYVMTLEAAGAQDMITGDPPPPSDVPEPGTLALLGAAFVGLVTTRRRAGQGAAAST